MSTYIEGRHDIGILSGSTKVGLMLARDSKGTPAWVEFDDEILAPQSFTDTPDYSHLPPEKEVPNLMQDDWRAGFGQKYQDIDDPKRYYYTTNVDARFNGKIIAGPKATAITKPSTPSNPSITDGNLELWDDASTLTNWTKSGSVTLVRDGTNQEQGTYCAQLANATGYIYQDLAVAGYRGCTITFAARCKTGTASNSRLTVYDGVDTTNGTAHTGSGAYEDVTVAHTINVAATTIQIRCENYDTSAAHFDGPMSITVTAVTVGIQRAHAEFNNKLYQSFGRILGKLNGTGTTFDLVAYMPNAIMDMYVFNDGTNDYLVIAIGAGTNYHLKMTTSETFTQHASEAFTYCTATTAKCYGVKVTGSAKVRSSTDLTTWVDVTAVGHKYDNYTDLFVDEANNVIVCKEDMPYYIDSSNDDQPLMPEFGVLKTSTSGLQSLAAFGNIYIQGGSQTLKEFDGTPGSATAVKTNISPSGFISDLSNFSGKIQGLAADDKYVYAIINNDTKVEVLAGNRETINGSTDWRWHPIAQLTLTGCQHAYVSSVYKKRLWICSTLAGDDMHYYPVTTKYGDIANDSDYAYQTDGYIYTPWLHGNFRNDNKAWIKLSLTLGHTYDANIYFIGSYKKWGDSSWTSIGNFKGTAANRIATAYIDITNKPVSPYIQFRFQVKTDDTSKSPILERYHVTAIWKPTKRWLIACAIEEEEDLLLADGQVDKETISNIKSVLDTAAAATWPVTMYDPWGSTIYVNFLHPMRSYITDIEYVNDYKTKIRRRHELLLQKITLT